MTRRFAVACLAAVAAAVSVGALAYAVLWAFSGSDFIPAAQEQAAAPEDASRRRKPPVIVAPRAPGDDAPAVVSPGARALSIALIELPYYQEVEPTIAAEARHTIDEVIADSPAS